MNENVKLPNTAWNEARIPISAKAQKKLESNWAYIQENERLLNAYCEKHGLTREAIKSEIGSTLKKAKAERL